jgi:hypothetical protein
MLVPGNFRIRWAVHNAQALDSANEEAVVNSLYVRFVTVNVSYEPGYEYPLVYNKYLCRIVRTLTKTLHSVRLRRLTI